jgi:altronate dehydratase large subunit
MSAVKLKGYRRRDNLFGIRNHLVVMASVSCANSIVERIAAADSDVVPITHQHGCTHIADDTEQVLRTLAGTCSNANVGAVLLVGLGCETLSVETIASRVDSAGKMVETLVIQQIGSIEKIMDAARRTLSKMKEYLSSRQRCDVDIGGLIVGLECGGSDPFSGITANPAVGLVSDRLVELGATAILSEIPEMIGAEAALEPRIHDEAVRQRLFARIRDYVAYAKARGCDLRGANPTPGNMRAGLSSIEEKSLGCIVKGGRSEINEFVQYAGRPACKGLVVMDTPGNDNESVTGMAAGGAHLILFTTGVGTPLGNPVAPVIKISSNTRTYERMKDFIDVDAGRIVGGAAVETVAEEIFNLAVDVCNGRQTASERNRCREFAINRIGWSF